ncbi:hypothetical protein ACJX0J_041936 [Zea mays]
MQILNKDFSLNSHILFRETYNIKEKNNFKIKFTKHKVLSLLDLSNLKLLNSTAFQANSNSLSIDWQDKVENSSYKYNASTEPQKKLGKLNLSLPYNMTGERSSIFDIRCNKYEFRMPNFMQI